MVRYFDQLAGVLSDMIWVSPSMDEAATKEELRPVKKQLVSPPFLDCCIV